LDGPYGNLVSGRKPTPEFFDNAGWSQAIANDRPDRGQREQYS